MEPDKGEIVRQKQLAFIDQMPDSYAGSMEDRSATIGKSAGWLGNCLQHAAGATDEECERFARILSTIERKDFSRSSGQTPP